MPRINVYYPVRHSSGCSLLSNGNHRRIKDDPPGHGEEKNRPRCGWSLNLRRVNFDPPIARMNAMCFSVFLNGFFPFEFLVICGTLGFMEVDKFFSFFSIQTELYRNRVNYVSLRRNRSKFQVWNRGGKSCSNSEIYGYFLLRNNMGVYNVTRSIRNF